MLTVSFYSYKGGSGRSTTAWNTIQQLAEIMEPTPASPFVIVDTDTQSAGATFLYDAAGVFTPGRKYLSVQKRMVDGPEADYDCADSDMKGKFFDTMFPIGDFFGLPEDDGKSVLLMGADVGRLDNTADVEGKNEKVSESHMQNFFSGIYEPCVNCDVKALFFDTPSGTQFMAKKSVDLSDIVVCCMRPSRQFRQGTRGQIIDFLEGGIKAKSLKRKYILTPTAVCVDRDQEIDSVQYPMAAYQEIKNYFNADRLSEEKSEELKKAFRENVVLDMLELVPQDDCDKSVDQIFGIPEVKRFKWEEACLGKLSKRSSNDNMALKRFKFLAETIDRLRKEGKIK